jgi:hypothetical protein
VHVEFICWVSSFRNGGYEQDSYFRFNFLLSSERLPKFRGKTLPPISESKSEPIKKPQRNEEQILFMTLILPASFKYLLDVRWHFEFVLI